MIRYLEGTLLKKEEDRILLLANQVGYEVLLPVIVRRSFRGKSEGDSVSLYIFHHQTERQPRPVLIGFNLEVEREFFDLLLSVDAVGPMKAIEAMSIPVREIAHAIEANDTETLRKLKGVGGRTAQKIVAALSGKMGKFAMIRHGEADVPAPQEDFRKQVLRVLVSQLGHKAVDAKEMIARAMEQSPDISTPEQLFDAVYRVQARKW